MQMAPDATPMKPALQAFFDRLEFHRDVASDGTEVLSVGRTDSPHRVMAAAINPVTHAVSGMANVRRYGIHAWTADPQPESWPEHDEDRDAAETPAVDLIELYASGRSNPALDEFNEYLLQQNLMWAAGHSPVVRAWTERLDFDALHVFDHVFKNPAAVAKGYNRIVDHRAAGDAMREFVRKYPLLAGLAVLDDSLWETAKSTFQTGVAWRRVREHVVAQGFLCQPDGLTDRSTGPLSEAMLDAIEGQTAEGIGNFDNDHVRTMGHALHLGRRLPVEWLPKQPGGWLGLGAAGHVIRLMEMPRGSVQRALDDGIGLGMSFTDGELARIFRHAALDTVFFGGLAVRNGTLSVTNLASKIARYGVAMEHREWLQEWFEADKAGEPVGIPDAVRAFDFDAVLKPRMTSQIFVQTAADAEELNSEFAAAAAQKEAGPQLGA